MPCIAKSFSTLLCMGLLTIPFSGCKSDNGSSKSTGGSNGDNDSVNGSDTDSLSNSDTTSISDTENGGGTDNSDIGCQMVDFLFVIDSSISMKEQQAALISSFPGFIETIRTTLNAKADYHIAVVDTDAYGRCTKETCNDAESTCRTNDKNFDEYICDHVDEFNKCDLSWGAGVVHPAGASASNRQCSIAGGNRYIVESDPDMSETFACIAQVGLSGNPSERPMDAMVAAVSDKLNEKGGCNEGFLRDNAILVVTFVTDDPNTEDMELDPEWDDEFGPSDTVKDWYNALVAAKKGNDDSIVVLGLLPIGSNSEGTDCSKGDSGTHWEEFVGKFSDHGLIGPVCETEYVSFFEKAVAMIDDTCDEFVPVL